MPAGLRAAFASRFGAPADVVSRAPGRVNLMGEHTDYNAGLCLPVVLPCEARAAVRARPDGRVRLASRQLVEVWEGALDEIAPGTVTGWAAYAAGVLWALREDGYDVPGVDLLLDSTVPIGAGLSSSAAVEVAVGLAVAALLGPTDPVPVRERLVAACIRAETEVAGAPTGGLDQTVVLCAEPGAALRLDFEDGSRRAVPLGLAEDGLALLVVDTRVTHALVGGGYGDRRLECRAAAEALGLATLRRATPASASSLADPVLRRRTRHVVTENARVDSLVTAIEARAWDDAGRLFVESHASLRDDFEVSCRELDLAVSSAVSAGALGARMTGGGFGGSAVVLVPESLVDDVVAEVGRAFADAGLVAPAYLRATPASAASVLVRD